MGKRAILMKFLSLQRASDLSVSPNGGIEEEGGKREGTRCLASIVKESRFGNGTTNCRFTPLNANDKRGTATTALVRLLSTERLWSVCYQQKVFGDQYYYTINSRKLTMKRKEAASVSASVSVLQYK